MNRVRCSGRTNGMRLVRDDDDGDESDELGRGGGRASYRKDTRGQYCVFAPTILWMWEEEE